MCPVHVYGRVFNWPGLDRAVALLRSNLDPKEALSQQPLLGLAFNKSLCSF